MKTGTTVCKHSIPTDERCVDCVESFEHQCWICPLCFDDHSRSYDCTAKKLTEENARLRAALTYYAENAVYVRASEDGDYVDVSHIAEQALEIK